MRSRPRRLAALTGALVLTAALSAGCAKNGDIVGGPVPASGADTTSSTSKLRTVPAPTSPAVADRVLTLPRATEPAGPDPSDTAAPIASPATSPSVSAVEVTGETPPDTTLSVATMPAGPPPASAQGGPCPYSVHMREKAVGCGDVGGDVLQVQRLLICYGYSL